MNYEFVLSIYLFISFDVRDNPILNMRNSIELPWNSCEIENAWDTAHFTVNSNKQMNITHWMHTPAKTK